MRVHRSRLVQDMGARPRDPDVEQDLVLDRDELDMLEIFHRSFNLPGLRLGLVRPICSDDYFPEDEAEVDDVEGEPSAPQPPPEPTAADELAQLLAQTSMLRSEVDEVLTVDEEDVVEEVEEMVTTKLPSVAGTHVRSVRRPGSGARPPSRPTSSGARPPRR
mgnify:CR=1 FL=1